MKRLMALCVVINIVVFVTGFICNRVDVMQLGLFSGIMSAIGYRLQ